MRWSLLKKSVCFLFFILLLIGCKFASKQQKAIQNIEVDLSLTRIDAIFSKATPSTLPHIKKQYPLFFPDRVPDSVWQNKLTDTLEIGLYKAVEAQFSDFSTAKKAIEKVYKHALYHFPKTKVPDVYTVLSQVDYKNKVILADSILVISTDTYLGKDHPFYAGISTYIKNTLELSQLPIDIALAIAKDKVALPEDRTFLSQIIYQGKLKYVQSLLVSEASGDQIMGYTPEKWDWARANESQIWRYFIEKQLLYATDQKLKERFILPAPFSKFYLSLDNESPGQIGVYIGWQIVYAYMQNNAVSLQQMLRTPAQQIFMKSKFKPKK